MADGSGATVWSMAHLATPMAVRVAATLQLADHLAARPTTAAELATVTGTNPDALARLLEHLRGKGLFTRDGDGRYALEPAAQPLRSDHPSGTQQMLDIEGAVGRAELSFVQLLHSVRTGQAAFPRQFGKQFWEDLAADSVRSASFDVRMGDDMAVRGPDIVTSYDWSSLGHVTDVGGGVGALLRALLDAFPSLTGTVFDMPGTADIARRQLAAADVSGRAEAVGGSFFDPLPVRPGSYLLSSVIHDWDDEHAVRILRRCGEAVLATPESDGRVFVIERIGADGVSAGTAMDLRMLAYYGGRERRADELSALADAAGMIVKAVHPAGALSVLELTAS